MPESISTVEHYKRVCAAQDLYTKRMEDSFKLFVQVSIATIGGFIWLKMQPSASTVEHLFPLARLIIPFVAVFTALELASLVYGWFGFRQAEARLLARPELMPQFPRSGRLDL